MRQPILFWANIDVPTQMFTVHRSDCIYKPKISQYKGVNKIERSGGWMSFEDVQAAKTFFDKEYSSFYFHLCKFCKP